MNIITINILNFRYYNVYLGLELLKKHYKNILVSSFNLTYINNNLELSSEYSLKKQFVNYEIEKDSVQSIIFNLFQKLFLGMFRNPAEAGNGVNNSILNKAFLNSYHKYLCSKAIYCSNITKLYDCNNVKQSNDFKAQLIWRNQSHHYSMLLRYRNILLLEKVLTKKAMRVYDKSGSSELGDYKVNTRDRFELLDFSNMTQQYSATKYYYN